MRPLPLSFAGPTRIWDHRRNVVIFYGEDAGKVTACAISSEALSEHFGAGSANKKMCLAAFDRWKAAIERKASEKHDAQNRIGSVLLRKADFP